MQDVQQKNSENNETSSYHLERREIIPKDNTKALSKFCYKSATKYKIMLGARRVVLIKLLFLLAP